MLGAAPGLRTGLTIHRVIRELDEWLSDEWLSLINPDPGRKKLPRLKELGGPRDLREKMVAGNTRISNIRNRWQVRACASSGGGLC